MSEAGDRQAGYPYLDQLNQYASLSAVLLPAAVSAATVGAVLATRRPRHPVGWLLSILGLLAVTIGWAPQYALYGHLARPGAVPVPLHLGQLLGAWGVVPACLGFILLLTPTGSLPSPRWQWWARVLAAASLVVRFRRARGVERQQLRWVGLATVLTGVAAGVYTVGVALDNPVGFVGGPAGYVTVMPIVIGAAVIRYRLYDLDRIISRTIAYGLLTVILGCGYAGVALGLGQLLGRGGSSLAVAGATLAVAAAFQPARHRIQGAVDRRFNRRRYDAARTIEGFSRRLRQEIDLDSLTAELAAVVNQTWSPARCCCGCGLPSCGERPPHSTVERLSWAWRRSGVRNVQDRWHSQRVQRVHGRAWKGPSMTPVLNAVGIVTSDMARSLEFYRHLGLDVPDTPEEGHVNIDITDGIRLMLDSEAELRKFRPDWDRNTGNQLALAFQCESPSQVDEVYARVTAAGFQGDKAPWDAFWGQRYAQLRDPDGVPVDLYATI